jgi:hypothetical protein
MKSNYLKTFLPILLLTFVTHFLLISTGVLYGQLKIAGMINLSMLVIFLLGVFIITPGLKKSPENFSIRFLILTTVQLLLMLIFVLILVTTQFPDARYWGFTGIFLFVFLLIIQSSLLVKEIKSKN